MQKINTLTAISYIIFNICSIILNLCAYHTPTDGDNMKKFLIYLCCFLSVFSVFFVGCKEQNPLYDHISELRCCLFEGESENFRLKACYGFRETPYNNDGQVCSRVYKLSFRLEDKETDNATFNLTFTFGGVDYDLNFKLNPVTHSVTANATVENFDCKDFTVTISSGSLSEKVDMKNIVPENTMDYKSALDHLYSDQKELINAYTDQNGNFNAEIYARIVVKNQKPYWYIGIASGNGNLKALLIDGFNGQTLAIREIF